jgi:hypothetical protein
MLWILTFGAPLVLNLIQLGMTSNDKNVNEEDLGNDQKEKVE